MNETTNGLEIAIIGISCRFPGAKNLEEFWDNLAHGVESISFFTYEELSILGVDIQTLNNPNYVKAGGVLEGADLFDARFFGFNPQEAEITDPQHRIFLECAWEALENAGYNGESRPPGIGVFAGASLSDYLFNVYDRYRTGELDEDRLLVGIDKDFLTTRVSYKLNLQGPSYTVQTACSTSLVAVHLACQSLLNGECDLALAGGVSLSGSRQMGHFYTEGGISSPDGHCRAFDAQARGTVRGEGAGIVVLKRLEEAIADRDTIHGIIKGSALNNDGGDKVSYSAPRIDSQAKVIKTAQAIAEVAPETITYIEAHGTGTILGDPIEFAALTQAFNSDRRHFCALGSVKTNIGHLDAAAGVAGLIKTVLALKHRKIPPSLHFEQPNPQIDFANSPFYVNAKLTEWQTNDIPRRAGVSSFGVGGTNAHLVLEEAPVEIDTETRRHGDVENEANWDRNINGRERHLLLLSAKNSTALENTTQNLAAYLDRHPHLNLRDVAYTLQVGRRNFDYRRVLVAQNSQDAVSALCSVDPQPVLTLHEPASDRLRCASRNRPVAFMFSPQGSQYVNMGREIYQTEPIFTKCLDDCAEQLKSHLGLDLRTILYSQNDTSEKLRQTAIAQPALFAIEYALAQLWISWGIKPAAAIGHSIGEYVAATIAGVFSLEDALALVATRGRLMQQLPPGGMLSVALPEDRVRELVDGRDVSIASLNSPNSCVVSGTLAEISLFQEDLQLQEISSRPLHTSHAFHSPMMAPILDTFREAVAKIQLHPPQIPFISNVTGTWITADQATDPDYWAQHLRQPVRFSEGVAKLLQDPTQILLEVGPGNALSTFAKQQEGDNSRILTSLRHPQQSQSDVGFLLGTLGQLWLLGVSVDWESFSQIDTPSRIPLPTYPFDRQRYWLDPAPNRQISENVSVNVVSSLPLEGEANPKSSDWLYTPVWQEAIAWHSPSELPKWRWLIFLDEAGLGQEVAKRLERQGQHIVTVVMGDKFDDRGDFSYEIAPREPQDYHRLLKALTERQILPQAIAHFGGVTDGDSDSGFYSLLFLTQALAQQQIFEPLHLTAITSQVCDVTGSEEIQPQKAQVLGLCKVISQEYPHLICRHFDISLSERSLDRLTRELLVPPTEEAIAYRGNRRWVQTYQPLPVNTSQIERLRQGGVYVITGGLGGIGLILATYLVKEVQAKLILVGRSWFPPRSAWSSYDATDEIGAKIAKIEELEKLGGEVLVVSANVADLSSMQEAIALATEQFGQIHGVIHAAHCTTQPHTIVETNKAECDRQFHAKVKGLQVLETLFADKKLDFFVVMSSLSSILGGLGFAAYAAANSYMDAFANRQNQQRECPWLAINWDGWNLSGQEASKSAITPEEGGKVFHRILSLPEPAQMLVSTSNLSTRIERWLQPETPTLPDAGSAYPRPSLPNPYVAPRNDLEEAIAAVWRKLLGIAEIGIYDNFFDLGGDSLLATQVVAQLRPVLQVEVSLRDFFDRPTIADSALTAATAAKTASDPIIPRQQAHKPELDGLSDAEVDALLKEMLAAKDLAK
jgi:acyl transferase domain-containing protein